MKTLSFIAMKGGPGKTALSDNTAIAFAQGGARVLIIDNDKQGNTSDFFNVNSDISLADLYLSDASAQEVIQKTSFANLDIIPGSMDLKEVELTMTQANNTIPHTILRDKLSPICANYDICVIDNPPDVGITVVNALLFTNDIIILTMPDEAAIEGVHKMYEQIASLKQQFHIKCLFNQFISTSISYYYKAQLLNQYSVFNSHLRFNRKLMQRSGQEKKPFFEISPRSGLTQDFWKFLNELTK